MLNPEQQKSDSGEPSLGEAIEQTAKGCQSSLEGCYGCIGIIAILLFCVGFIGLRAAFRGGTEASDIKVELRQQPDDTTFVQEHLLKPRTDSHLQPTSYLIRIIGGLFGLAAAALGAILLVIFGYSLQLQRTRGLDKKDTTRRIKKIPG